MEIVEEFHYSDDLYWIVETELVGGQKVRYIVKVLAMTENKSAKEPTTP